MESKLSLCTCGHPFRIHWGKIRRQGYGRCYYSGMTRSDLFFINAADDVVACKCEGFKRDNLKYLERLDEAKSIR